MSKLTRKAYRKVAEKYNYILTVEQLDELEKANVSVAYLDACYANYDKLMEIEQRGKD